MPWMEHDVPALLEPEVEDVFDLVPDVVHEAFDLSEQGLLVREGTADHAVSVVFPVSGRVRTRSVVRSASSACRARDVTEQSGEQMSHDEDPLCAVFMPALVVILHAAEQEKGEPLTEAEVLSIRDDAVCMTVPLSVADDLERSRGYSDIPPADCWHAWLSVREQIAAE